MSQSNQQVSQQLGQDTKQLAELMTVGLNRLLDFAHALEQHQQHGA